VCVIQESKLKARSTSAPQVCVVQESELRAKIHI
jgi:hypothetical protein